MPVPHHFSPMKEAIKLDDVDKGVIYALQKDARGATTIEIGEQLGVSASTVRNRIERLEKEGIITGYHAMIDYEKAGFPLHVLLVCTADFADRNRLAKEALNIPGVVNVREFMVGESNVRAEAIGTSNDDITRIAREITDLGLTISQEILIRNQYFTSFESFKQDEEE